MKKSDELRIKTRKMIAKNLIILVALAVVAFVGAYSWFSDNTKASAEGLVAKTKVSDALEFFIVPAKDNSAGTAQVDQYSSINSWLSTYNANHPSTPKSWHIGSVTLDPSDAEYKFLEDLFLCETTSDGISYKIPKLVQFGEIAYVDPTDTNTNSDFETAVPNENYMSFDIYFRCKSENRSVQLTDETTIIPLDGSSLDGTTTYDTTVDANEESVKPASIGAVRMSVLNANNERQLLWIPAPCVWYNGANNLLYTGLSGSQFDNKGSATSNGSAILMTTEGTNNHAYYSQSGRTKTRHIINSNGTNVIASEDGDYTLTDNITVVTLNQRDTVNDFYYGHVRVNLWMEGEDAEARLKMVGGKFVMSLCFDITSPD